MDGCRVLSDVFTGVSCSGQVYTQVRFWGIVDYVASRLLSEVGGCWSSFSTTIGLMVILSFAGVLPLEIALDRASWWFVAPLKMSVSSRYLSLNDCISLSISVCFNQSPLVDALPRSLVLGWPMYWYTTSNKCTNNYYTEFPNSHTMY